MTVLPFTVLLLAIAFGSLSLHQQAMRQLVGERDEQAVRAAASALTAQVNHRQSQVYTLSLLASGSSAEDLNTALTHSAHLLPDFDHGLAFYNLQGNLLAYSGNIPLWNQLNTQADSPLTALLANSAASSAAGVTYYPEKGEIIILVSANDPEKNLAVVGAFSAEQLARQTLAAAFPPAGQATVVLVDPDLRILYQSGSLQMEGSTTSHPGFAEALNQQSGTAYIRTNGGDEHVIAYSPVPPLGWGLVMEESWEMLAGPTLRATQLAPLILVPVLLLALLALWFGLRQIIQPLRVLESQAAYMAWGNFKAIDPPVGGIDEIQHLQAELVRLAHKVQAAQQGLHGYIAAITAAQEDERRRLARELHDDTIQSLIALKQRIQWAQLKQEKEPVEQSLIELEGLAEQSIQDLRRITRDLRPIYLEDLGLATALEMLARESEQNLGFPVLFSRQGIEKRLDPAVELALYRIAQETLRNIGRHANASKAELKIVYLPQNVTLQTDDNGRGFPIPKSPAEFAPSGHYGLLGMYERAELIGAQLKIESDPGQGTKVQVNVPIPRETDVICRK